MTVKLTPQQVFDKVADHLFTQGKPAYFDAEQNCMYRWQDNGQKLACAAGCLIDDAKYHPGIEGRMADDDAVLPLYIDAIDTDDETTLKLIRALQEDGHDPWARQGGMPDALGYRLRLVASRFRLDPASTYR